MNISWYVLNVKYCMEFNPVFKCLYTLWLENYTKPGAKVTYFAG